MLADMLVGAVCICRSKNSSPTTIFLLCRVILSADTLISSLYLFKASLLADAPRCLWPPVGDLGTVSPRSPDRMPDTRRRFGQREPDLEHHPRQQDDAPDSGDVGERPTDLGHAESRERDAAERK